MVSLFLPLLIGQCVWSGREKIITGHNPWELALLDSTHVVDDLSSLPAYANSNTVILIDVDNTAITASEFYGSINYFVHLMQGHMKSHNVPSDVAGRAIYSDWIESQRLAKVELRDKMLPLLISQSISKGALVFGFTARQPVLSNITLSQLRGLGVHFSLPHLRYSRLYHNAEARMDSGVVFCHESNDKGLVFGDWIRWLSTRLGKKFRTVVLVDDMIKNHNSVLVEAYTRQWMDFEGIYFPMN